VLYVQGEKEKKTPAKPPAWGIYNWAWKSRTPPAMREQIHDYAMKAIEEYLAKMPEGQKVFTVMQVFPDEAWSDEMVEHLYRRYGEDKTFGVRMGPVAEVVEIGWRSLRVAEPKRFQRWTAGRETTP
jgi:hypothetical protein